MSIELVMPSNHLIFCCPFLLLPSIFPSIRVFSNESALRIRWPKYWSFSFNISPSNEHSGPQTCGQAAMDGFQSVSSSVPLKYHLLFRAAKRVKKVKCLVPHFINFYSILNVIDNISIYNTLNVTDNIFKFYLKIISNLRLQE